MVVNEVGSTIGIVVVSEGREEDRTCATALEMTDCAADVVRIVALLRLDVESVDTLTGVMLPLTPLATRSVVSRDSLTE